MARRCWGRWRAGGGSSSRGQPPLLSAMESVLDGFAQRAAAMFHLEQDVVVNEFADGEAGAGESNRVVAGPAAIAKDLHAVPPGWRMIAGRAQIEDEFERGKGTRDEAVGGASGAFVGVVDDDEGVVGELGECECDAVILIAKGMAAVVEIGANARGTPWRGGKEIAEVDVVEGDLAGRGVRVQRAAESVGGAVELREIVACEDARARVGGRGANEAGAFVASHFDVNFALIERGDGAIEEPQLVLGGHAGNLAEDVRERAIGGMRRAGEAAGVVELGPLRTASLEKSVKAHFSLFHFSLFTFSLFTDADRRRATNLTMRGSWAAARGRHQYIAGPIGPTRPMPYGLNISSCMSISSICWASRFWREISPSFAWNCSSSFNFSYF